MLRAGLLVEAVPGPAGWIASRFLVEAGHTVLIGRIPPADAARRNTALARSSTIRIE